MDTQRREFNTRRPSIDDAQMVLDLITACDIAAYGEPDYDLESLLDDWSDLDLDQDAWLVTDVDGQLIGYASVNHTDQRFTFDMVVHPAYAPEELPGLLLAACEARANEQSSDSHAQITATIYLPHVNLAARKAVEERGFELIKYHFGMRIDIQAPPPEQTWPQEVSLRNAVPGQDDRIIYDFIQAAFDWPGRTPPSFERWRGLMVDAYNFDRDLWFLAFHGDELVGAVLCFEYPQYGWVRQLGVAQDWRRQGLGAALLRHVFGVFYRRGHRRVGLVVESGNPKAFQFYERVGMKRVQQYIEYRKILANG